MDACLLRVSRSCSLEMLFLQELIHGWATTSRQSTLTGGRQRARVWTCKWADRVGVGHGGDRCFFLPQGPSTDTIIPPISSNKRLVSTISTVLDSYHQFLLLVFCQVWGRVFSFNFQKLLEGCYILHPPRICVMKGQLLPALSFRTERSVTWLRHAACREEVWGQNMQADLPNCWSILRARQQLICHPTAWRVFVSSARIKLQYVRFEGEADRPSRRAWTWLLRAFSFSSLTLTAREAASLASSLSLTNRGSRSVVFRAGRFAWRVTTTPGNTLNS